MPWYVRFCALVLLLIAASLWPRAAQAQIRRCVGADGAAVFTDRRCEDIGSVDSLPRTPAAAAGAKSSDRGYRGGCARNLQDLVFQMTSAIESHDANRLAGVYHWTGMSGSTGYSVLERLDAIARRPLVDIVPVMSTPAAPSVPPSEPAWVVASDDAAPADAEPGSELTPVPPDPDYYPQTSVRRTPVALRVEQTLSNGSTPSHTVFGLIRHFGCWWIKG